MSAFDLFGWAQELNEARKLAKKSEKKLLF